MCVSVLHVLAGVQYSGHTAAINSMCYLPGASDRVASCDQHGCVHIWSCSSGKQTACFSTPSSARKAAQAQNPGRVSPRAGTYDLDTDSDNSAQEVPLQGKPYSSNPLEGLISPDLSALPVDRFTLCMALSMQQPDAE